jgi:hypothetical protein
MIIAPVARRMMEVKGRSFPDGGHLRSFRERGEQLVYSIGDCSDRDFSVRRRR